MKRIFNRVRASSKSEFVINASKLMTGSVISQVIPILAAPILSRIYLPSDYGELGLYMSVTGLVSIFATLQYASAILIAQDEDEVYALIKWCLYILSGISCLTLIFIVIAHNFIGIWLKSDSLPVVLWMAPLSILMTGLSGIFSTYAIRQQYFSLVSANRVMGTIIATLCSLSIGYFLRNPIGLFVGLWVGQIVNGLLLMSLTLQRSSTTWARLFKTENKNVLKRYINFPKFSLPSDFINGFTNQIPLFMLNTYGSVATVGSYSMGNRILGLPIGFISQSFGEVFRQRAAHDYRETGSCKAIFVKTFKTLALLSIVPFAILIIWGPDIFAFVLGEKWREAGHYSQIMGIMFFFRFTVSPLTYMFYIAGRQKEDFYLHLLFLLIAYLSFSVGYRYFGTTEAALFIFSLFYSGIYCIYLSRSYSLSLGSNRT